MPVTYDDVQGAQARIRDYVVETPVLSSPDLDDELDARVWFKMESHQPMGAFKLRGAFNALLQFDDDQRAGGVIAYSSGNHAQAIARAARDLGIRAVIVMPEDAPAPKIAATRGYGAEVVLYDRYTEDRETIGAQIADERGMTLIPPYDHDHIIAGQGTAAIELLDAVGDLDIVVTPLGGGGLLSGTAIVAKSRCHDCAVYGVEPTAGNDGQRSLRQGSIVTIETPRTIADGVQTLHLGQRTFPILQQLVTDIVTVDDEPLIDAMQWFAGTLKSVVEPTSCLPLAAIREGLIDVKGKRVGIIVTGGNVDLARYGSWLAGRHT